MLFRINRKNFIIHMIDHFTREEILGMNFVVVSDAMKSRFKVKNVVKLMDIFPSKESASEYVKYRNIDVLRKNYFEDLDNSEDPIYEEILKPIADRCKSVVIVCHENEDDVIDILFEYLLKKYNLQAVDLNKLFEEGKVNTIKHNQLKLKNRVVDINRRVTKQAREEKEKSSRGRMTLLQGMTKKQKRAKLKELGIRSNGLNEQEINGILIDEWVED